MAFFLIIKLTHYQGVSRESERTLTFVAALRQCPMDRIVLFFILFVVLSTILPMIFRLFRTAGPRNKARILVEYAQKRGYRLVNPSVAQALDSSFLEMVRNPALKDLTCPSLDIADIDGLENGTGDRLAFVCTLHSKEVTIFNFSVTTRVPSSGGARYKVAKIKVAGLPRFSLGRNSVVHTVEIVVGKLVGEPNPAIVLDAGQYPEFSAHYWLRGADGAAVTAFLSPSKIKFIENTKLDGILAANPNYLVYFEHGVLLREEDCDSFIARVETIVANLL